MGLFVVLALWQLFPMGGAGGRIEHSILILLALIGLGLYPLLIAGWASNRKYALIGALRGVAQTISYEIRLALLFLRAALLACSAALAGWASLSAPAG